MKNKLAKDMTKQDINRMAKFLISEKDQPQIDINLIDDMWYQIDHLVGVLDRVRESTNKYKENFQSQKYRNYEEFKKDMKKNLQSVIDYSKGLKEHAMLNLKNL